MPKAYQPLCPLRGDAKCTGAMCALSLEHVDTPSRELYFSCSLAGEGHHRAVIDRRDEGADPVRRT